MLDMITIIALSICTIKSNTLFTLEIEVVHFTARKHVTNYGGMAYNGNPDQTALSRSIVFVNTLLCLII